MELFASIYEWFGTIPFFSTDMGDQLRGWDITCTAYIGSPWYLYMGWTMIGSTGLIYALQYHMIDSPRWYKKQHWWIFAAILVSINFLFAFLTTFNMVRSGDYCEQLNLSYGDCLGIGFSNGIWSLILFILITSFPLFRNLSVNNRLTTFWKP